jgi:1,4-dihydroxy-2-naphthoyl-CoA hydrolase
MSKYDLDKINKMGEGTAVAHLGMHITYLDDSRIEGTMPIDQRTVQPLKLLHGGISAAFAETLGSIASNMYVHANNEYAVGLNISANHLKAGRKGIVKGIGQLIHKGKKTHVWDIKIFDEEGNHLCQSSLTMMILSKTN